MARTIVPPTLLLVLLAVVVPVLLTPTPLRAAPFQPACTDDLAPIRREEYGGGRIVDITHAIHPDMPKCETAHGIGRFLWLRLSMANGSIANFSELKLSTHTGTHIDARATSTRSTSRPGSTSTASTSACSMFNDLTVISEFDLLSLATWRSIEVEMLSPALLVDVPRDKNITAEVMESLQIPRGVRRVLLRTLNTDRQLMWKKECDTSFVGFMKDGARWLVDNTDIKLVGTDYLSVAAYDDLAASHLVFLKSREIILVEALKLDNVKPGIYDLRCLPLRLRGAEARRSGASLSNSKFHIKLAKEKYCYT
uniref:Kynurenine formamidase n=1 Tax=Ananas comosus var. bracteatus TaxID=296719 RepID=A0A6V7PLT4_ANACO|nr:unnamed protein product [Ananas comosus var. bracteatus]